MLPRTPLRQLPSADSAQALIGDLFGSSSSGELLTKIALSVVVVVVLWVLRRFILRVALVRITEPRAQYNASKIVSRAIVIAGIFWIGFLWFERFGSLGTFLGLMTAGLAIALRDVIANLAGWLFILVAGPFAVGDRMQIGANRGDVVHVGALQFTMLEIGNWVHADQSTGRLIHIPNADVFRSPIANSTMQFPYIWNELPVTITFESDWRRAKGLLLEITEREGSSAVAAAGAALRRGAKKFLIHYSKLTPTVYTSVADSGVMLTIRYLTDPRRRRGTAERIWEAILDRFANEPHIDLAYPTQRFFSNPVEGKAPVPQESSVARLDHPPGA